jgi:Metallo-beta-lactamase superfamily
VAGTSRKQSPRIEVEVFPAGIGDSILVRCISDSGTENILVDGGVKRTYEDHLATRLKELANAGERLDLLIVTHIDTDHIGGALELLKANGDAAAPQLIPIDDIWHNGYRHLGLKGREPTDKEKQSVLSQVSGVMDEKSEEHDISFREADSLAELIVNGGYKWNHAFGGGAILAGATYSNGSDLNLTVLSPTQSQLDRLAYAWKRELLKMGVAFEAVNAPEFAKAFELAMQAEDDLSAVEENISSSLPEVPPDPSTFVEDQSDTNASSIAFLLAFRGLRILMLADAWPSVICQEAHRLFGPSFKEHVNMLKVSHHSSKNNSSPELLSSFSSDLYVVSTNGAKHRHPHSEAILWAITSGQHQKKLIFNYPSATSAHIASDKLTSMYGHEVQVGNGKSSILIEIAEGDS